MLSVPAYTTTTDVGVVVLHGSNGLRDASFGVNGLATIDLGGSLDFSTGAAVDGAGRVLISGWNSVAKTFIVARLNPAGALDSSFAAGGIASNPIDPLYANPSAGVIVTAEGVVVGGRSGPGDRTTLARYLH